jgi:2-keto-4-pentenoate hydratase
MGSDVLEGQWETLTLLVNQLVKQGYTIEPHHILITGSLGKLLPLKVGTYRAEYSALGELVLEVKP